MTYSIIKKFLFSIDEELSHELSKFMLSLFPKKIIGLVYSSGRLLVKSPLGLLRNPVGLAAGFDKEGLYLKSLSMLGFGYVVAGSVTLKPKSGNPKPRVARLPYMEALVNCMGLPNPGIRKFIKNIINNKPNIPLIISIAGTHEYDELLTCYSISQRIANGIEVNFSSPSIKNSLLVAPKEKIKEFFKNLRGVKSKPTFLKLPPISTVFNPMKIEMVTKLWHDEGFEGITAVNTKKVKTNLLSEGYGGISGRPLFKYMIETVRLVRSIVNDDFFINAVGGIMDGESFIKAIESGANTVQLFTGIIYKGPSIVKDVLSYLLGYLENNSVSSVRDLWNFDKK